MIECGDESGDIASALNMKISKMVEKNQRMVEFYEDYVRDKR